VQFPPPPDPEGPYASAGDPAPAGAASDPLGTVAIVFGCIGIVFAGVVMAIVAALLASFAGSTARAAGRSLENAYIAFALAAVDGVVWLVLHMFFDIGFLFG
jgi:hypothetical protein